MDKLNINEFIRKVSFLSCHKFKLDIPAAEIEDGLLHINDLMALSDDDFVESVYRKILRRVADAEGKQGKLADLESGSRNRLDILDELKSSDEAKNYKEVVIVGLGEQNHQVMNYNSGLDEFIIKNKFSDFEFTLLLKYLNVKHFKSSEWLVNNEGLVFDLLEFDGLDFIFLTYKVLLQRDPDHAGFSDYIANFDNSYISKIEIIYEFSQSGEYNESPVVIKDLSLKEIGSFESPEEISFDLNSQFESLHHFLFLRNEKFQLDSITIENLVNQNILCFMFLLMEKFSIPFSERLGYFNQYIPQILRKEKTKIDIVYLLINERDLCRVDIGVSFSNNAGSLLTSLYNEGGAVMVDMLGKDVFCNATKQDAQTNNIYYRLSQEAVEKDIYKRCKDQVLEISSTVSESPSLNEELYSLTNCIKESATKSDIEALNGFMKGFIEHIDLMAEVLVDHENKMSDWEANV